MGPPSLFFSILSPFYFISFPSIRVFYLTVFCLSVCMQQGAREKQMVRLWLSPPPPPLFPSSIASWKKNKKKKFVCVQMSSSSILLRLLLLLLPQRRRTASSLLRAAAAFDEKGKWRKEGEAGGRPAAII